MTRPATSFEEEFAVAVQMLTRGDVDDHASVRELLHRVRKRATTSEHIVRLALLEARWLFQAGAPAEALLVLDQAEGRIYSDDMLRADVLALRARILAQRDHLLAASQTAQTALKFNPAHVEARLALAEAHLGLNEPHHAINLYHEVLPLLTTPEERARIHLLLARTYRSLNVPALARLHARMAHSLAPLSFMEQLTAFWYRLSSLRRGIAWLTVMTIALLLGSILLGSAPLWPTLTVVLVVLVAVGATAWFNTPVVEDVERGRRLQEQKHLR